MIHPSAIVSPEAEIGAGCEVGAFSIINAGVELGAHSFVGSHCELGVQGPGEGGRLVIGEEAVIRSMSVLYLGSTFGAGLKTGHRVTLREGMRVGDDAQFGTLTDVQGDCTIGRSFRSHSNVHIGKHSTIGDFVWIFPYVVLTNDPHPPSDVRLGVVVEDFAVIATMTTVLPGVRIGRGAFVGAHSLVRQDVGPERLVAGSPARDRGMASDVRHQQTGEPAYPWTSHFQRGYAPEDVARWAE